MKLWGHIVPRLIKYSKTTEFLHFLPPHIIIGEFLYKYKLLCMNQGADRQRGLLLFLMLSTQECWSDCTADTIQFWHLIFWRRRSNEFLKDHHRESLMIVVLIQVQVDMTQWFICTWYNYYPTSSMVMNRWPPTISFGMTILTDGNLLTQ